MADVDVDLLLQPGDLRRERRRQAGQRLAVDRHADRFHRREDRDQGQLDLVQQAANGLVPVEIRLEWLARGSDGNGL